MNLHLKVVFVCIIFNLAASCGQRYGGRRQRNSNQLNVYGQNLQVCSTSPMTGWYRDGKCRTDAWDRGSHTVCAEMTQDFLDYTKSMGNDLSTPRPWGFPGLRPGDRWCLCSRRWRQAMYAGKAPLVALEASHRNALRVNSLEEMSSP